MTLTPIDAREEQPDADVTKDVSQRLDVGREEPDVVALDASMLDTHTVTDNGALDRGAPDNSMQDHTAFDAGTTDTQTPDVGPPDSGLLDAGKANNGARDTGPDGSDYTFELYPADATYNPLDGVTTTPPVDYLELRQNSRIVMGEPAPPFSRIAQRGTPCATARDRSTCEMTLAGIRDSGWMPVIFGPVPPQSQYLVFTHGDRVGTATTYEALATFVAPVDTPNNAALLAVVRGHRIVCGERNTRAMVGGVEITAQTGQTCGAGTGIDANRVRVTTTGTVAVVSTVQVREGEPGCAIGRCPAGLKAVKYGALDDLDAYFAAAVHLEAASMYAL
jgi:hypothetical protein